MITVLSREFVELIKTLNLVYTNVAFVEQNMKFYSNFTNYIELY